MHPSARDSHSPSTSPHLQGLHEASQLCPRGCHYTRSLPAPGKRPPKEESATPRGVVTRANHVEAIRILPEQHVLSWYAQLHHRERKAREVGNPSGWPLLCLVFWPASPLFRLCAVARVIIFESRKQSLCRRSRDALGVFFLPFLLRNCESRSLVPLPIHTSFDTGYRLPARVSLRILPSRACKRFQP